MGLFHAADYYECSGGTKVKRDFLIMILPIYTMYEINFINL